MLPNFLIIGAPRAGTTWIAKNLMEHPEVYMPRTKELHYFDCNYEKGKSHYEQYFNKVKNEKAVGEGTPDYLYFKQIPEQIHNYMPDAKLILSLRNPVDRLYSRYWNSKAKYPSNKDLSFEEKLKKKPLFIEEGRYYDHLMRYYKYFPKNKILIMFYEDIKLRPKELMKEIYTFLEVDNSYVSPILLNKINSAASKKNAAKSVWIWNVYRGLMRLRLFGLAKYIEKLNASSYPPIKEETKKWLIEEVYFEQNEKLAKLIGKDLKDWEKTEY